uniref:Uncharacterized protein n=1 Tax=viral metagenome TaxID=1070528 RepID=A0A6H1ZCY9_9ZZZZ
MRTYRCTACGTSVEVEVIKELNIVEVKPCEACLEVAEEAVKEESRDQGYQEGWQAGYDTATEEWEEKEEEEEKYGEDTSVEEEKRVIDGVLTGRIYPLMSNIEEVEKGEKK